MVYATTLCESQRVIFWQLIIKQFGPNIHHIAGVDNIVADTLSRLPSTPSDNYEPCTRKAQFRTNKLFVIGRLEKNDDFPLLNILIVQREKTKELRNTKSNLSKYTLDRESGYSMQELDDVKIICYDRKIYVPKNLHICVLDCYHFYLNHPGGSIIAKKTIRYVI